MIEILIVLSIVMIFTHFLLTIPESAPEEKDLADFLETFESDLFYLQQYTITHQIVPQLFFYPKENEYSIKHISLSDPLIHRKYSDDITIQLNDFKNPLTFTVRGNLTSPGNFHITFKDETYKIIFSLGKGRFRIEKFKTST